MAPSKERLARLTGSAWPAAQGKSWWRPMRLHRMADLAPLAAVLLFLAAIISSIGYLRTEEARRERQALQRDAQYIQQQLRQRLMERQEQILRLAHDLGQWPPSASALDSATRAALHELFDTRAQSLLLQQSALLALHWIDAQGHVQGSAFSPSAFMLDSRLPHSPPLLQEAQAGMTQARQTMQPVLLLSQQHATEGSTPANADADALVPVLQAHAPIARQGQFDGVLLAEFSPDALLRHDTPPEMQGKYVLALMDGHGQQLAGSVLTGRSPPETGPGAWLSQLTGAQPSATDLPASVLGPGVMLRIQPWRTSQTLVGNSLLWLLGVLAALTVWMLLANWQQARQRQQMQQALLDETSFRRAMENSMLTGMRALDMQGRITYVNPAFCQITGWTEEELIGHAPPFPYWAAEDHAYLSVMLEQELRGETPPSGLQLRAKRKDGSIFDARLFVSPLIDASGQQTGWIGSLVDITEPNRVRQQLSASHDRFTTVMEALDASVSVAPLGSQELLFANKLYRQWFDNTTSGHLQLLERGGAAQPATAPHNTPGADEAGDSVDSYAGLPLEKLIRSPAGKHPEIYIERLDKWLEVRSRYLSWVDGRLAQMVIATDITLRRQAQQQAEEQALHAQTASRLITMGEMASSVAHELNQPLTAISNYCNGMISRLKKGGIQPDELLGALDKTARQAQRAGQVVQHIRSFVKRSEPRRQWSEVPPMIEQVLELANIELRHRRIELTPQVAPHLPTLFVDPILIEQVLLNLIKNAAESITAAERPPGQRHIGLTVQPCEREGAPAVCFAVTDNGRGLPPEVLARLYEAFFSTKSQGMGIGLNLCRSIVEAHQGRIEARNLYNADLLVGCQFTFWIPLGPAPDVRQPDPHSPA